MEEQIEEFLKEKSTLQVNIDPTLAIQTSYAGTKHSATLSATDAAKLAQGLAIQKNAHEKLHQIFQVIECPNIKNGTLYVEEMQKTH